MGNKGQAMRIFNLPLSIQRQAEGADGPESSEAPSKEGEDRQVDARHSSGVAFPRRLVPLLPDPSAALECLPQHFPSSQIQFFSIDESDVGLRTVIQLGVDSFPMLQVVQPHPLREFGHSVALSGPRQLQHIVDRVAKITGVAP
eukprot:CAMPEP_0117683330 /NCGR_PEP_ID=MMETSP0804-20121206/20317_1 /TAXON_ID=1074897 /ORGANISM="Tetraselmis astigmatica, Strain CCMP880" /LENGTH=143 /DNA_ID=CAMNT_0005493865 /DNA_START=260 /DNA_END=689 /DNA_ORIENTATION=+